MRTHKFFLLCFSLTQSGNIFRIKAVYDKRIMSNVNINNNLSNEKFRKWPVYRLPFPHDPPSELAREVYCPSKSAEHIYDGRRELVAEALDFCDSSSSLVSTIVRLLVKWYKGGRLDASLSKSNRVLFGELLDTELPIETVVLLNVSISVKIHEMASHSPYESAIFTRMTLTGGVSFRRRPNTSSRISTNPVPKNSRTKNWLCE